MKKSTVAGLALVAMAFGVFAGIISPEVGIAVGIAVSVIIIGTPILEAMLGTPYVIVMAGMAVLAAACHFVSEVEFLKDAALTLEFFAISTSAMAIWYSRDKNPIVHA